MISQDKVDAVRRLIDEGKLSQRQIATQIGVSRGTVGAVASGKRLDRLPCPTDEWNVPTGPIVRCPGCGGRVYSPCRLCRVRDRKATEALDRRQTAGRDFPLNAPRQGRPHDAGSRENDRRRN